MYFRITLYAFVRTSPIPFLSTPQNRRRKKKKKKRAEKTVPRVTSRVHRVLEEFRVLITYRSRGRLIIKVNPDDVFATRAVSR